MSSLNTWTGDIVYFIIGLSYRPVSLCSLAGRYDNPMPESTLSPPVRDHEFDLWKLWGAEETTSPALLTVILTPCRSLFNCLMTTSPVFPLLGYMTLKGQCHEIFCFWFFSWISFPPAPEYPIRTVSNCFENSRRYSQVKVHHRGTTPVANLPPVSTRHRKNSKRP